MYESNWERTLDFQKKEPIQINTLTNSCWNELAGKTCTGEGSASSEKLEKSVWRPKGRQLTSLEVCKLLKSK